MQTACVVKARGSSLYQELGVLPGLAESEAVVNSCKLSAQGASKTFQLLRSTGDRGVEEAVDFARLIGREALRKKFTLSGKAVSPGCEISPHPFPA